MENDLPLIAYEGVRSPNGVHVFPGQSDELHVGVEGQSSVIEDLSQGHLESVRLKLLFVIFFPSVQVFPPNRIELSFAEFLWQFC